MASFLAVMLLIAGPGMAQDAETRVLASDAPVFAARVVRDYPHDRAAFTQGLAFADGFLYEGTGLRGKSSLRRIDLSDGRILQSVPLAAEHFGEGITLYKDRVVQLTWQSGVGFVYDRATFELLGRFEYPGEGWGIACDGRHLILSDGTSTLRLLDPEDFEETGRLEVFDGVGPVDELNELEYVGREILANIRNTEYIARISPETGRVLGWIDLSGLPNRGSHGHTPGIPNGIAYDATSDRLLVTGKHWPHVFEIEWRTAPNSDPGLPFYAHERGSSR